MRNPVLYINRDLELDWLIAVEFGWVVDGQPDDHFRPVGENFAYCLDGPDGDIVGFGVGDLTSFDVETVPELWGRPHFDAPLFGLRDLPAAAVVLAAQAQLREEPTTNRMLFGLATNAEGERAVALWRQCLESGDSMAHYSLGYTLLELGRPARPTATCASTSRPARPTDGRGAGSAARTRRSASSPTLAPPTGARLPSTPRRRTRPIC